MSSDFYDQFKAEERRVKLVTEINALLLATMPLEEQVSLFACQFIAVAWHSNDMYKARTYFAWFRDAWMKCYPHASRAEAAMSLYWALPDCYIQEDHSHGYKRENEVPRLVEIKEVLLRECIHEWGNCKPAVPSNPACLDLYYFIAAAYGGGSRNPLRSGLPVKYRHFAFNHQRFTSEEERKVILEALRSQLNSTYAFKPEILDQWLLMDEAGLAHDEIRRLFATARVRNGGLELARADAHRSSTHQRITHKDTVALAQAYLARLGALEAWWTAVAALMQPNNSYCRAGDHDDHVPGTLVVSYPNADQISVGVYLNRWVKYPSPKQVEVVAALDLIRERLKQAPEFVGEQCYLVFELHHESQETPLRWSITIGQEKETKEE